MRHHTIQAKLTPLYLSGFKVIRYEGDAERERRQNKGNRATFPESKSARSANVSPPSLCLLFRPGGKSEQADFGPASSPDCESDLPRPPSDFSVGTAREEDKR